MLEEILEESWAYQEIMQKGRKEGELQALHQTLQTIVQARFPQLADLAAKRTAPVHDPVALQTLIVNISLAQAVGEAEQYLLATGKDENEADN